MQGGGGRKIPPGASAPSSAARGDKPTSTPPTATAQPATKPTPTAKPRDGFDTKPDPRLASERAAISSFEHVPTTGHSGIDSMVRVLEDSRTQILDEHRAVREKLQRVIGQLALAGFERGILDDKRAEIIALRTRLGALRRRLQHIQRRLKAAFGKARPGDADLSRVLAGQLERLQKLEPGVERAFVALSAFEQAFGALDRGAFSGSALKLVGDASAEDRGNALARAVPGAAVAVGIAHLLMTTSPQTPTPSSSSSSSSSLAPPLSSPTLSADHDADPIANLQGLADLLLQSL